MQRIKHILFDFDGTIADSKDVLIELINELGSRYRIRSINAGNLAALQAMSLVEKCRFLGVSLFKLPVFIGELLHNYRSAVDKVKPVPGILPVLERLQAGGIHLSILSSNSRVNIERFLANYGFEQSGDISCSGDLFGKDRLIRKYLRSHCLRPEDLIYIGDEQRDIAAAKKAGVASVWVSWGYDRKKALGDCMPDLMAARPEDLLHILDAVNGSLRV